MVLLLKIRVNYLSVKIFLRIESKTSRFTKNLKKQVVEYPIAHSQGKFYAERKILKKLRDNDQVAFKYTSSSGDSSPKYNPNGSVENIAGITNKEKYSWTHATS